MGIAAYRRGNVVISRGLQADGIEQDKREQFRRAVAAEIAADEWRRAAWGWFVDASAGDVRGFCGAQVNDIVAKNGRVFRSRLRKVQEAQRAWLDVHAHDQFGRTAASQNWARAVHYLLSDVTWGWKCTVLHSAPRACVHS